MTSAESKAVPGAGPLGARKTRPARSSGALELSEADIARTCSDLLQADGWRMIITDPVSDRARGKGFGELGMADRLYIRYASLPTMIPRSAMPSLPKIGGGKDNEHTIWGDEVMWIEWKRERRRRATKPTELQMLWHQAERARGAFTLVAGVDFPATIGGFREWYAKSGLARR